MPVLTGRLVADGALVEALFGWSRSGAQSLRAALRPVPSQRAFGRFSTPAPR